MKDGTLDTKIIIIENGIVSDFVYHFEEETKEVLVSEKTTVESISDSTSTEKIETETVSENKEKLIYWVQLGFYKKDLSYDIFKGLDVKTIKDNGGTYYYVGSFTNHQDALIKQSEMKVARGFSDAFIVTYKNGERINISKALITEKKNKRIKKEKKEVVKETVIEIPTFDIKFIVQIGVWEADVNTETLKNINSIGGAEKIRDKGSLYKYIAGRYNSLSEAEFRKSEVSQNGFTDSFIYAEKDGKRIKVREAVKFLNK